MRSVTRGHLKAGIDSVRRAKWRNFWTMLGIIIGVASVISIVSIGEGVKQQIGKQVARSGDSLITIRPGTLRSSGDNDGGTVNILSGLSITGTLQPADVEAVAKSKGVTASAPLAAVSTKIKNGDRPYDEGLVIGTRSDLPTLINRSLAYGVFMTPEDEDMNVAILGSSAADELFDVNVPLGYTFTIGGEEFIVRGIFDDFGSTPLSDQSNYNSSIFIPYNVAQRLTNNTAVIYEILAKTDGAASIEPTIAGLESSLQKTHGGQNDFSVLRPEQTLESRNAVLDLLTGLVSGVAAISLLVGGIGIMNVMLVSVTERMKEIGIRKAIGATNRQIMSQFMIESSLLSVTGGLIGVGVAFVIDGLLRFFTNLRPVITWEIVAVAFGVSLVVGIVFGTIPALKAARKDPIDALRAQ